jgi:ATP-binding cassette subfamily F protein uup
VQVAYFDQMRDQLDLDKSVAATLSPGSDWVEVRGERRHVTSYLADFLFPPQRAGTPVRALSGGERNRLLLARLFARPANVLVLDEPTNDLDIESLELLEQVIQDFEGTLLLVSHDRAFVDNVVTQTIAPLGDGRWREYVGGYSDWLAQRPAGAMPARAPGNAAAAPPPRPRTKLSFKDQRALEALPGEIEALESEQRQLTANLSSPDYPHADSARVAADGARIAAIEALLMEKLERWEALEAEANRIRGR